MDKPKIFIASSWGSEFLAEQLRQELSNSGNFSDVRTWSEDGRDEPGTTITKRLCDRAQTFHYAAVFLTKDDVLVKKGTQYDCPRDNCIFEAGFFSGAFGGDFKRCFLICDVVKEALPSDLQELEHITFARPDLERLATLERIDFNSLEEENRQLLEEFHRAIRALSTSIVAKAKSLLDRPVVPLNTLTSNGLMELERVGANLEDGSVVVNATQPLERNYRFALRVMRNMKMDVDYIYFFHANPTGTSTRFILKMIYMISLAELTDKEEGQDPSAVELANIMKTRAADIRANLEFMRHKLSVHFLKDETPLEFCVHNAESDKHAKCYLRHSKNCFVLWHKDKAEKAMAVAENLRKQSLSEHKEVIFRSTKDFDLRAPANQQFTNSLYKAIERYFSTPELRKAAEEACFGDDFSKIAAAS